MKYLGIDQSYNSCGVVLLDDTTEFVLTDRIVAPKADVYDRAIFVSHHLAQLVEFHNPNFIALEGLAFGMRGDATRDLAGLQFAIVIAIRSCQKPKYVDIISPLSLKKFATGSGKAKKKEMIEALPKEVKQSFLDEGFKKTTGLTDVTDAFWLAKYIQHKYLTPTD